MDRSLGTPINQIDIDEENKRHATYLASMDIEGSALTTDVLAKFAVKYNTLAHHLLANYEPPLAPALHSCTPVIGDMFMVVMQYIPAGPYTHYPGPVSIEEWRIPVALKLDATTLSFLCRFISSTLTVSIEDVGEAATRRLLAYFPTLAHQSSLPKSCQSCCTPPCRLHLGGARSCKF